MTPTNYRTDIDGLRAIAVVAVMAFHFGYFPNGYLGVDVFFAISGYLITGIIYNESLENRFSLKQFYIRRIRRIMPLILFINLVALITGILVMLPDDLENLSQSIIATNFFSNNILQEVTTKNYWDAANEYKPLMHTWSLGIEEQFYLLYPLLLILINPSKPRRLIGTLLVLTITSLAMLFTHYGAHQKFHLLPFRLFELSAGGLLAICTHRKTFHQGLPYAGLLLLLGLLLFAPGAPGNVNICLAILAALLLLTPTQNGKIRPNFLLQNKLVVAIGKLSFSLYMWHQLALAFTRYFILQDISAIHATLIFIVIVALSVVTYYFIERPFRDATKVSAKRLLWITGTVFALTSLAAWYVYSCGGIIHDVPELNISRAHAEKHIHVQYNEGAYEFSEGYQNNGNIKVVVIGNSFARDWVNILRESKYSNKLDILYIPNIRTAKDVNARLQAAQYIFFSELKRRHFDHFLSEYSIDTSKVWIVGTKNFGTNNGIFYNKKHDSNYYYQRTKPVARYKQLNNSLKRDWGNRYIDLLAMITDNNGTVPVFTPDHKFISQDCKHLTKSGAVYIAQLLEKSQVLHFE